MNADNDTSTAGSSIEVCTLSGALGAEIRGVDLRHLDEGGFESIRAALIAHQVIFVPAQGLDPDEHRAFAARFGPLENHPYLPKVDDGHPELSVFDGQRADMWHTDVTFMASPPIATVFQMIECPDVGGDTMWSSLYHAYETLSTPLRDLLDGLTAVHDARVYGAPDRQAVHPAVRVVPETGRRCLYVNRVLTSHFVELSRPESNALLAYLFAHAEQPAFTVRWRWRPGDVAVWDNRCTMHHALNDYGDARRVVHRAIVLGDNPHSPDAPRWPAFQSSRPPGLSTLVPTLKFPS